VTDRLAAIREAAREADREESYAQTARLAIFKAQEKLAATRRQCAADIRRAEEDLAVAERALPAAETAAAAALERLRALHDATHP
jgi:hypothetical protein